MFVDLGNIMNLLCFVLESYWIKTFCVDAGKSLFAFICLDVVKVFFRELWDTVFVSYIIITLLIYFFAKCDIQPKKKCFNYKRNSAS